MPTLFPRPIFPVLALLAACTVPTQTLQAQSSQSTDLHIKKSITAGGNFVSSSETSIKGARERTVSQQPTGPSSLSISATCIARSPSTSRRKPISSPTTLPMTPP